MGSSSKDKEKEKENNMKDIMNISVTVAKVKAVKVNLTDFLDYFAK